MTKVFGPLLGASQLTLVGEVAESMCLICPAKTNCAFDGAGTYTSGSQAAMNNTTSPGSVPLPAVPRSALRTRFLGYQILGRLEYNNLIGA